MEISPHLSALLLNNNKQILIHLPHTSLCQQFHRASSYPSGILDLTSVSGDHHNDDNKQNLEDMDMLVAYLPDEITGSDTPKYKDLKITIFAHYRLDKNPTAKYCQITISWDNIGYLKSSVSGENTTWIQLHEAIEIASIQEQRSEWWFDMPTNKFQELINIAQMSGKEHLDLRDETRKRTKIKPPTPPKARKPKR